MLMGKRQEGRTTGGQELPPLLPTREAAIPRLPSNQYVIVSTASETILKGSRGRDPGVLRPRLKLIWEDRSTWEAAENVHLQCHQDATQERDST